MDEPDPRHDRTQVVTQLIDAAVLADVVEQLRKDLGEPGLIAPPADQGAFEALRAAVLQVINARSGRGSHALGTVLYRVDVPERHARAAMERGGLPELAGRLVLRTLQKVLTRRHFRPPTRCE